MLRLFSLVSILFIAAAVVVVVIVLVDFMVNSLIVNVRVSAPYVMVSDTQVVLT